MNRPLKFKRVYLNYDDTFYSFVEWGMISDETTFSSPTYISGCIGKHDLQFTGLHDKNGTAIYEGDVCKVCNAGIGRIIWHEKHCQFKIVWLDKIWLTIRGNNWERYQGGEAIFGNHELTFEVIGDIFSNPELLTQ